MDQCERGLNNYSIDGLLGTRTRGGRMEGADIASELGMAAPYMCQS